MSRQHANIKLQGMDLRPLDRQRPDGVCELIEGLRPEGSREDPYWVGIPSAEKLDDANPILAASWHIRTRRGEFSDSQSSLTRLIVLRTHGLSILDPEDDYSTVKHYSLGSNSDRRASFSQIGEGLVIGLSVDGKPEETLVLYDDEFIPLEVPDLPGFEVSVGDGIEVENEDDPDPDVGLPACMVAVRIAWLLKSGEHSPLSTPIVIRMPGRSNLVDGGWIATHKLDVSVDPYVDDTWEQIAAGVTVFIATADSAIFDEEDPPDGLSDEERVLNALYHEGGAIDGISGGEAIIGYNREQLLLNNESQEDTLSGSLTASVVHGYNERLVTGNTAFSFVGPATDQVSRRHFSGPDPDPVDPYTLWVRVDIEANGASYALVSEIGTFTDAYMQRDRILIYPDRRGYAMSFWTYDDSSGQPWIRLKKFTLKASDRNNYSFNVRNLGDDDRHIVDPDDTADHTYFDELEGWTVNTNPIEYVPNRVVLSRPNSLFTFSAGNSYRIGDRPEEAVQDFAVNALPISTGQFGEYPLFAFTENTTYALEQIGDANVAFGRISPQSLTKGAIATVNADQAVFVLNKKGLYILGGGRYDSVSKPVDPEMLGEVDDQSTVGYFQDDKHKEVWVGTSERTWCYSLIHNRWFILPFGQRQFFSRADQLWSVDFNRNLTFINTDYGDDTAFVIKTGPMNLGAVDYRKRLFISVMRHSVASPPDIALKGEGQVLYEGTDRSFRSRMGSFYDYEITLEGVMGAGDHLHSMDMEYETRYTHKIRRV